MTGNAADAEDVRQESFISVLLLIGFRNRLTVMREWVWAYFTRNISARLITGKTDSPTGVAYVQNRYMGTLFWRHRGSESWKRRSY
jgi:hypothetical protein